MMLTFNVVSKVQSFDIKLQSYEEATVVTPHLAFSTQQREYQPEYKNTTPSYNPNYRGRGRSNFNRGRGGYSTRGGGFSQHQTPYGNTSERPVCQICGRMGHTTLKCYNRFDNNYQSNVVFNSLCVTDEHGREWFPYSGASAHVTSSASHIQDVHPYEGTDAIMVGDGAYLPITHTGSATITSASAEGGGKGTQK